MSADENIELMRTANVAWNGDDWDEIEALTDPEVEMVAPEGWPESGTFRGWPALRRQYERLKELEVDGEKARQAAAVARESE